VRSEKEELMGDKTIARGSQHRVGFVPLQKSLFRVGNVHTKPIYQYLETNCGSWRSGPRTDLCGIPLEI
jgi:hypothetical protein